MNLKHPGSHRLMMCIAGLALLLVIPICSCGTNGSNSTPSGTASPDPTIPTCNPICADTLNQPGIVFVGQVKQITQPASSSTTSSGALSVRGTMYTLLVSLPQDSSPGTKDQLTLIANTQLTLKIGDFIKVVATPNNDTNHTFTVQQPIKMVTQQDFQTQLIEYQGEATMSVSCPASGCADQAISFGLGGLTFNFRLNSQTNVQGFGTPPSITAKQMVDVIVRFVQGASPSVLQVTNPSPSSLTPTLSPTQSQTTTLSVLTVTPTNFTDGCTSCVVTLAPAQGAQSDLNWQTRSDLSGVTFNPQNGTLSPGQRIRVTISVPQQNCPANATFIFTGGASPVKVGWTCASPLPPSAMQLSTTSLSFNTDSNCNSPSQTITVTNSGSGTLTWNVGTPTAAWLQVAPRNGSDAPGVATQLTFAIDQTQLKPPNGKVNAMVDITPSTGPTQTVTVTLNVTCFPA